MPKCDHCLRPMEGFAGVDDRYYCHPDDGMDCYHLVTVYRHPDACDCIDNPERGDVYALMSMQSIFRLGEALA
jgi:hypothetical protein